MGAITQIRELHIQRPSAKATLRLKEPCWKRCGVYCSCILSKISRILTFLTSPIFACLLQCLRVTSESQVTDTSQPKAGVLSLHPSKRCSQHLTTQKPLCQKLSAPTCHFPALFPGRLWVLDRPKCSKGCWNQANPMPHKHYSWDWWLQKPAHLMHRTRLHKHSRSRHMVVKKSLLLLQKSIWTAKIEYLCITSVWQSME